MRKLLPKSQEPPPTLKPDFPGRRKRNKVQKACEGGFVLNLTK